MSQLSFTFVYETPKPEPVSQAGIPAFVVEVPVPEPATQSVVPPEPASEAPQVTFSFV